MAYKEQELNLDALDIKSGGGGRDYVNHKIKNGDNIYRILPPFGEKANGKPFAEFYISWGFTDSEGNKKPVLSTLRSEGNCPIFEAVNELDATMSDLVREFSFEEDKKTKIRWQDVPAELKVKYDELKGQRDAIRPQRGFFYNAVDQTGTVGILRLPKTGAEQLNGKIKDAVKRLGFNPLSLTKGCSFNIRRDKTGPMVFNVEYNVDLVKTPGKDEAGNIVEKYELSSVPEDLIENFEERAYDVHSLYRLRTSAELRKIMSGDTSIFDREAVEAKAKGSTTGTVAVETDSSDISLETTAAKTTVAAETTTKVATPVETTPKTTTPAAAGEVNAAVAELSEKLGF